MASAEGAVDQVPLFELIDAFVTAAQPARHTGVGAKMRSDYSAAVFSDGSGAARCVASSWHRDWEVSLR